VRVGTGDKFYSATYPVSRLLYCCISRFPETQKLQKPCIKITVLSMQMLEESSRTNDYYLPFNSKINDTREKTAQEYTRMKNGKLVWTQIVYK